MPLPGYTGSVNINSYLYGVKSLDVDDSTDLMDSSNTESPVALIQTPLGVAGFVPALNRIKAFETRIQGFSRVKIRLSADWGADAPFTTIFLDNTIVYPAVPPVAGGLPGLPPSQFAGSFGQAGGGGPPRFDVNSPLFIDIRCGDRWIGFFNCEKYNDKLEIKGLIGIELEMISNGQYLKNPTIAEIGVMNAIMNNKFGVSGNYWTADSGQS